MAQGAIQGGIRAHSGSFWFLCSLSLQLQAKLCYQHWDLRVCFPLPPPQSPNEPGITGKAQSPSEGCSWALPQHMDLPAQGVGSSSRTHTQPLDPAGRKKLWHNGVLDGKHPLSCLCRWKKERWIFVIKLYLSHNTAKEEKAVLWITIACHFHSQTPSTFQLNNPRHWLICTYIFIFCAVWLNWNILSPKLSPSFPPACTKFPYYSLISIPAGLEIRRKKH